MAGADATSGDGRAFGPDWIRVPGDRRGINPAKGVQMAERAAIVTGGSSGIGLAIARMLGQEGYGLTVAARRPDKLKDAADSLRADGYEVQDAAGDMGSEDVIREVVAAHTERFGRLDVLVNNAGVGIGAPVGEIKTKQLDIQLGVNLRSIVLFYRECVELLRAAAKETGTAQVINTASIAGKSGQAWLSVYSATKHGVVGFTQSMNKELGGEGIKSCALCPGVVDTPMTDFVKQSVAAEQMIRPEDVAAAVRMLLTLSPACVIPEIVFQRPDEML
jgi:NAD(P)-dependent dehydrogenase (short-subunit alcohol dehydrogenase family)